jgi:hypothetical protein
LVKGSPATSLPHPTDPRAFEEACLVILVRNLREDSARPAFLFEYRDAWLEGSYPDTVVMVRYVDRRDKLEKRYRTRLWETLDETESETPYELASQIMIDFIEP